MTRCDDDVDDADAGGGGGERGGEGARLSFDRSGALVASAPAPRARGTTVAVRRLFEPLPVRRRELLRTARREGARVVSVLQGYAVAVPKLRLVASDQRGGGARAALLQSPGGDSASARSAAAALWGPKVAASLVEVDAVILSGSGSGSGGSAEEEEGDEAGGAAAADPNSSRPKEPSSSSPSPSPPATSPSARVREEASDFFRPRVVGLVSSASAADKAGTSNNAERQFFSVNGRPVDLPRAGRVLNECWRALGSPLTSSSKPVAILDLRLPPRWCDVNVNPDKRRALLRRESALLEGLRKALRSAWEPSRATYRVNGPQKHPNPASSASASAAAAARAAVAAFAAGGGSAREMMVAAAAGAKRAREAHVQEEEEESEDGGDGESDEGDEKEEEEEAEPGPPPPQRPRASAPPTAPSAAVVANSKAGAAPSFAAFALGAAKPATVAAQAAAAASPAPSSDVDEEEEMEVEEGKEPEGSPPPAAAAAADEDATDLSGEEQEEGEEEADVAAAEEEEEAKEEEEEEEERDNGDDAILPASTPHPPPPAAAAAPLPPPPETVLAVDMGALRAACARKRALLAERIRTKQQKKAEEEEAAAVEAKQKENRLASSSSSRRFAASSLAAAVKGGDVSAEEQGAALAAAAATAAMTEGLNDDDDATEAAAAAALLDGPARAELERVFKRSEFAQLSRRVVGQFNLGFIVGRLGDDLFVVDQHASDEKATFEGLCSNAGSLLSRQPLLAPVPLDLAPDEAAAVREHAEVFRANGFEIVEVEGDSRVTTMSTTTTNSAASNSCGLALVAVPHSRGDVFGARDVADLAARLSGGGFGSTGADARFAADDAGRVGVVGKSGGGDKTFSSSRPLPRPPRVRAMLAMRACRSSIMVGRTLTKSEMRRVVRALAGLQSPWNCPHGRPTMRHLAVLTPVSAAAAASE